MRKLSLLLVLLTFWGWLSAQKIQWAAEVLNYSSQQSNQNFSTQQALGAPNAMHSQDVKQAWAPAKDDAYLGEFIHLGFAKPIRIQQVIIAESQNPGAIEEITLIDTRNRRHVVYENAFPQPVLLDNRLFTFTFPMTDYEVQSIKVLLKTSAVRGSNQIDAVGISADAKEATLQKPQDQILAARVIVRSP